jgi:hypothetical protein
VRIAQQIALAFGIPINKDVVRRILAIRYQPAPDSAGPSWLTVLGHAKDSLWSLDLFRCESAVLRTHWVLVVMDQCTRRVIGFGVQRGVVDGVGLCRMFNRATRWRTMPKYLSSDHDPLYRTMVIARTQDWMGARRNPVLTRAAHARVSVRIAGSRTVVGCIRRRWRRDGCDVGNSELCDVSSG